MKALEQGDSVRDVLVNLAITYKVFKAIGEHALGVLGYTSWAKGRKKATAKRNIRIAHEGYWAMTPEEKVGYIEQKFGRVHTLELLLAGQIVTSGVVNIKMNEWQSVPINGEMLPREADIKVTLEDKRKIVVLCDGEAFHGPKSVFVKPEDRVRDDVTTAEAYFNLGYSVLRYSENEIHSGMAIAHFMQIYRHLREFSTARIYRTWYPKVERLVA